MFAVSSAFGAASSGYTGKQDFLFKEAYGIPLKMMSLAGTVSSVWDGINDPLLGSWMDRRRFGPDALRTIMRISAVTGNIFNVVKMLDGGMTAWQHIILLMACNMLQDIVGTMDSVAGQKIRAGVSPLTQQRGRVSVWSAMGGQVAWPIANLANVLMGFSSVLHITDYQIIVVGATILLPFAIVSSLLPTFVRQRVDFSEEPREQKKKRNLAETFQVIKYNKYFIWNTVANFITVFTPDAGDETMIYRYLMPTMHVFGKPMSGEALLVLKQMLAGIPSTVCQPFNRQIINKLGGPLRAQKIKTVVDVVCNVAKYFVGFHTWPRFGIVMLCESLIYTARNWDGVAGDMLNYEFYDYVELKTGERSEGVTSAVNNLFRKTVSDNIGRVTLNAFLDWTGYKGRYKETGTRPPKRFLDWMWPMYTLVPVIDSSIWLTARCFVKWSPEDRARTELALAERRAALEQTIADAE
ncbi:MAG: MFS transporter [Oscillospiraceae bacterium]|nr:MFS transporter [Oscillospiraceae bacterium]